MEKWVTGEPITAEKMNQMGDSIDNINKTVEDNFLHFSKICTREFTSNNFDITGGYSGITGQITSGKTRLVSVEYYTVPEYISATALNNYDFFIYAWDENENYIGAYKNGDFAKTTAVAVKTFDFTRFPSTYKFKISIRRPNPAETISIEESENIVFTGNAVGIDKTLTVEGEAADAKTVGDRFSSMLTLAAPQYATFSLAPPPQNYGTKYRLEVTWMHLINGTETVPFLQMRWKQPQETSDSGTTLVIS